MRIGLIGYGKMGREIERLALERNIPVLARIDLDSGELSEEIIHSIDVLLHFASPGSVLPHVKLWAGRKKNLVIGTTGWQRELDAVREVVLASGVGVVHAPNFSLGMNIFRLLVKEAGRAFDRFDQYDVAIHETHHRQKLDSPSGTALELASTLLELMRRKKELLTERPSGAVKPEQLLVSSSRVGTVVGEHRVVFDSPADQIALVHSAKNRSGFAAGALVAAEWVKGKQGFFTMEDVLSDILR